MDVTVELDDPRCFQSYFLPFVAALGGITESKHLGLFPRVVEVTGLIQSSFSEICVNKFHGSEVLGFLMAIQGSVFLKKISIRLACIINSCCFFSCEVHIVGNMQKKIEQCYTTILFFSIIHCKILHNLLWKKEKVR